MIGNVTGGPRTSTVVRKRSLFTYVTSLLLHVQVSSTLTDDHRRTGVSISCTEDGLNNEVVR